MNIYVDLDNTLVNTVDAWVDFINEKTNKNYTVKGLHHYPWLSIKYASKFDYFWESGDEYCIHEGKIKPHNGAQEFIGELKAEFGKENVHIVTMPLDGIEQFKNKFIKHYFKIEPENIHYKYNKYEVVNSLGHGVLIDDYQKHIKNFVSNGTPAILWTNNKKYNWDVNQTEDLLFTYPKLAFTANTYNEVLGILHYLDNR